MRVFNVTPSTEVEYRGRMIPPNGGYVDLPATFIPIRDLQLEKDRILAFNKLPQWFLDKQVIQTVQTTPVVSPDQSIIVLEPKVLVPTVLDPDVLDSAPADQTTKKAKR